MLNLTDNIMELWGINISCASVDNNNEIIKPIIKKSILAEVISKAIADAVVVGGIVFFSTLASIGYHNLNENLYTALIASTTASGLSFFTELRKNKKKIWVHQNSE